VRGRVQGPRRLAPVLSTGLRRPRLVRTAGRNAHTSGCVCNLAAGACVGTRGSDNDHDRKEDELSSTREHGIRTTPVHRWGLLPLVPALALAVALIPTSAEGVEESANYREVPNNACDLDTPTADFGDRDQAAEVHRPSIDCVTHLDIAEGRDGEYHPREQVTRAQMASFIARSLEAAGDRDLPEDPDRHFEDTVGSAHAERIDQLAEIGVVEGAGDDHYAPQDEVTRAQMASFIVRAAGWNHTGDVDAYAPASDEEVFLDVGEDVHAPAIRAGNELWLFEGRAPGEFAPSSAVERGTMATFLTRMLDLIDPGAYETNNQTYLLSPAEPQAAPAGEPLEFSVDASRATYAGEDEPVPGPVDQALHIALLPCENATTDELPVTFAGDQLAADIAHTDQDHAYISEVQGEPTQERSRMEHDVAPDEDGRIQFTVVSPEDQPDCAVAVAFDDRAPTDELRLDAGNRPANAHGFVEASWY
jgi:hypothetical protein